MPASISLLWAGDGRTGRDALEPCGGQCLAAGPLFSDEGAGDLRLLPHGRCRLAGAFTFTVFRFSGNVFSAFTGEALQAQGMAAPRPRR
jgi:hypothetical protein